MFDINKPIQTIEAVEDFAKYLYCERKVAFSPDDSFEEYYASGTDLPRSGIPLNRPRF